MGEWLVEVTFMLFAFVPEFDGSNAGLLLKADLVPAQAPLAAPLAPTTSVSQDIVQMDDIFAT